MIHPHIGAALSFPQVATLAGAGKPGFADGLVTGARFNQPLDVAFDARTGRLFVSEDKGHRIRVRDSDTRAR